MTIKKAITNIKSSLPKHIQLVAVSKTKPIEAIQEAYATGHRIFGENKIQEMSSKWEQLPKDIAWHMIGTVQRNKVKYMAPYVALIHGVDSLKLLKEINKQAKKNNRIIACLLQVKIANEESKQGMTAQDAAAILAPTNLLQLPNIKITGLMGMASFTANEAQLNQEFEALKTTFDSLKIVHKQLEILSMGMSGDYTLAIANGSNMVRIGSSIFGARNYTN
jgi:hypothetical protein